MQETIPIETVERWADLPSAKEPAWLTGARPQGSRFLIRQTGQIVERRGTSYVAPEEG